MKSYRKQIKTIRNRFWSAFAPPPRLKTSEWAERFRVLSPEASVEHGPWRNRNAPYAVMPMDCFSPYHEAEQVVFKASSQTTKTEVILNCIGAAIDLFPGPILAIQPNAKPMGETFSKDRIAPMLRDCKTLQEKTAGKKGKTSESTIMHKTFPSGHLTVCGANSVAGLAMRPIQYLFGDELSRWELTKEGDPLLIARKRLQTFKSRRRSKEFLTSSPTFSDVGISVEYQRCTQQWEWQLQCQHCGQYQFPKIGHFSWESNDPRTLKYACQHCGSVHTTEDQNRIKFSGKYVCVKDRGARSIGFWVNQFSSYFATWESTIQEWIDAQGDPAKQQVVTNTVFADDWEGVGERVEIHVLEARAEEYDAKLSREVDRITIGADVQADRIECEVVAWNGKTRENWSLDYLVLPGEPTSTEAFDQLLDVFNLTWVREDDIILPVAALCIDAGAFTQHVAEFIRRAHNPAIIPIKGVAGLEREQVDGDVRLRNKRTARRLRTGKPSEMLGVDAIKLTVMKYLSQQPGRPGYSHFPVGRSREYYHQLTGERLDVVQVRGKRPTRRWKPVHPNVEALDCRVYAYAAMLFSEHVRPMAVKRPPSKEEVQSRERSRFIPERKGFIKQRKP